MIANFCDHFTFTKTKLRIFFDYSYRVFLSKQENRDIRILKVRDFVNIDSGKLQCDLETSVIQKLYYY